MFRIYRYANFNVAVSCVSSGEGVGGTTRVEKMQCDEGSLP
jgi:hypothetical protein